MSGDRKGVGSRGDAAHRLSAAMVVVAAWAVSTSAGVDFPPGVEGAMVTLIALPVGIWFRRDSTARAAAQAAVDGARAAAVAPSPAAAAEPDPPKPRPRKLLADAEDIPAP